MAQFIEQQDLVPLTREMLVAQVAELKAGGWRLVHVACVVFDDALKITYAFDKDCKLVNYRLSVPKADPVVPSISGLYLAAFTYENELQDLYGMRVDGLVLDFKGKFYRKRLDAPFNQPTACATAPATAPTAGK
jgi:ech hydrogenase subunit D